MANIDWSSNTSIHQNFLEHLLQDQVAWGDDGSLGLLAHYSSLTTIVEILRSNEIWMSHPLFMNDTEELRFGISTAQQLLRDETRRRDVFKPKNVFLPALDSMFSEFAGTFEHIYVFCFSAFDPEDSDGRLAMWRGYGGDGKGAALVIDASALGFLQESPLRLFRVTYETTDKRIANLRDKTNEFLDFYESNRPAPDKVPYAINAFWRFATYYALSTKHSGFKEEDEWRLVYSSVLDPKGLASRYFDGHVTDLGVEPKLKLPVAPIEGLTNSSVSFRNLVHSIVVGPSVSSDLSLRAMERVVAAINPSLAGKVVSSKIPYRS